MPHGYIRVRFADNEGMATMPGSQRRAPGHWCRLEFRISHFGGRVRNGAVADTAPNCPTTRPNRHKSRRQGARARDADRPGVGVTGVAPHAGRGVDPAVLPGMRVVPPVSRRHRCAPRTAPRTAPRRTPRTAPRRTTPSPLPTTGYATIPGGASKKALSLRRVSLAAVKRRAARCRRSRR